VGGISSTNSCGLVDLPLVLQNPNKREREREREREMGWLSTYTMKEGKSNKILRISIDIIMQLLGCVCFGE
jgi:hypothetical protein